MTKRALILEDTPQVVQALISGLHKLEQKLDIDIEVDVLSTQRATQLRNDSLNSVSYHLVLLDYFAPDGNFHVLDFESIGIGKVITISSIEEKNKLALKRGANCSVAKNNPITDNKVGEIMGKAEYILCTNVK